MYLSFVRSICLSRSLTHSYIHAQTIRPYTHMYIYTHIHNIYINIHRSNHSHIRTYTHRQFVHTCTNTYPHKNTNFKSYDGSRDCVSGPCSYVAVCCSVLQCVVLQCVAVCCNVLQCVAKLQWLPGLCLRAL